MNFKDLENIFEIAMQQGYHVAVEIAIPGQNCTEFIINHSKSVANKLEYYRENYDYNLVHKKYADIWIVDVIAFPTLPIFLTAKK